MTRPARSTVEVKNWVTEVTTEHQIAQQARIIRFLLWAYGCLLAAAMAMFFLQGFRLWGFQLDSALIQWLGGGDSRRGRRPADIDVRGHLQETRVAPRPAKAGAYDNFNDHRFHDRSFPTTIIFLMFVSRRPLL